MRRVVLLLGLAGAALGAVCQEPAPAPPDVSAKRAERVDLVRGAWPGPALCYSGYRAGQTPEEGLYPSREEVAEDLRLLARHWRLLRIYSANRHAEDVLEVIRREELDLSVMLGIWLGREPVKEQANVEQVAAGIRLAQEYPDVVVAVNVGNEVRVAWTEHPVPEERLIGYIRRVRAAVPQPVTLADNYVWWRDDGAAVAREVDFITLHTYPVYERRDIDAALSYTIENYAGVRAAHPGVPIVIGEAGWPTYSVGNQHVPRAGDEQKQARHYEELMAWAREEQVTVFWFEAFDEPWKGGGTEGHWGLFTADREAKPVVRALFPDRAPAGPTSPSYPERIEPVGPALDVAFRAELARALADGSVNPLGPGLATSEVVTRAGAEGGTALRLAFTGEAWGGVYFTLGRHDASAARALALQLQVPAGLSSLELKLEGPETVAATVDLLRYAGERDEHGWTSFSVPLAAFEGVDLGRLAVLGLWNPRDARGGFLAGDLVLDDVRLEGAEERRAPSDRGAGGGDR